MTRLINVVGLLSFVIVFSCSKFKHPYITIVRPANGQIFASGDLVEITADLYDNDAVTSEFLVVTKENTGDTIINFKDYTFTDRTYHLSKTFTSAPASKYKIVISAVGHGKLVGDTLFVSSN